MSPNLKFHFLSINRRPSRHTCKVLGRFSPAVLIFLISPDYGRHTLVKTDPLVGVMGSIAIIRTILMIGGVGVTLITSVIARLG